MRVKVLLVDLAREALAYLSGPFVVRFRALPNPYDHCMAQHGYSYNRSLKHFKFDAPGS